MGQIEISKWLKALTKYKRVGLDSMCFLYQFANHSTYSPFTNKLFESIEKGFMTAVTSAVTIVETFVYAERTGNTLLLSEYEKFFQGMPHFSIVPVDWTQARVASKLRAKYASLRTPDSLQTAAALLEGCGALIANDEHLRIVKELPIVILEDYLA